MLLNNPLIRGGLSHVSVTGHRMYLYPQGAIILRSNMTRYKSNNICHLQELAPFFISRVHVPRDVSPQLWVVMNAHSLKPSVDVSLRRRASNVDFVPIGLVKNIST